MRAQIGELSRQPARKSDVVAIHAHEILAATLPHRLVQARGQTAIDAIRQHPDTHIVEGAGDCQRIVGRTIVDEQQFPGLEILQQDRDQCRAQTPGGIEHRHADADHR